MAFTNPWGFDMHSAGAVLIIGVALAGCATSPTPAEEAGPASRVLALAGAPRSGQGQVIVRRDSGLAGVACDHAIRLDGKLIGILASGQELAVSAGPGEHTLEVSNAGIFCTPLIGGASFVLNEGQTKSFRTGFSGMFNLEVSQSAESAPPKAPAAAAVAAPKPIAAPAPALPPGQFGLEAAKFARAQRCAAFDTPAQFVAKGPGFETYSVPCTSGDTMLVRCEFGTCRALR